MLSIIKATKSPIELTEAARIASQNNEQIKNYLGIRLNVKNNWKLRTVPDMLLDHPSKTRIWKLFSTLLFRVYSIRCKLCYP